MANYSLDLTKLFILCHYLLMCSSINRMEISQALLLGSKQKRRKSEILSYLGKYFA